MADVEMKPVDEKDKKEDPKGGKKDEKEQDAKPTPPSPVAEIKSNLILIEKAVSTLEPRFTHRVLRTLTSLRKRINEIVLRDAIEEVYPKGGLQVSPVLLAIANTAADSPVKKSLLSWLPAAPIVDHSMDVDTTPTLSKTSPVEPFPEGEIYLRLLIIHHLQASPDTYRKSMDLAHETVDKMQALNRRSMDSIAAKIWYVVERSYELIGELADARP